MSCKLFFFFFCTPKGFEGLCFVHKLGSEFSLSLFPDIDFEMNLESIF